MKIWVGIFTLLGVVIAGASVEAKDVARIVCYQKDEGTSTSVFIATQHPEDPSEPELVAAVLNASVSPEQYRPVKFGGSSAYEDFHPRFEIMVFPDIAPSRIDPSQIEDVVGFSNDVLSGKIRNFSPRKPYSAEARATLAVTLRKENSTRMFWDDALHRVLGYETPALVPNAKKEQYLSSRKSAGLKSPDENGMVPDAGSFRATKDGVFVRGVHVGTYLDCYPAFILDVPDT
ncbi:hypothetical protein [Maritimibacter alexandrii]|uniref:hypothetical protein n=1 Tax=Maritimibacter alexandrii TaxID=2570355 RepID=UPI001108A0F0|nr:hypothetical protein [Maritimibacter alexandrii]